AGVEPLEEQAGADLAAGFRAAIVEVLAAKGGAAREREGLDRLVVAGGVGANAALRARLVADMAAAGREVHFPPLRLCTDNGAMIAFAAALRHGAAAAPLEGFAIHPRWGLAEAAAVAP